MHMEVRGLFGRFVWRGINIYADLFLSSMINPTLKVCEHNRVAHASLINEARRYEGLVSVY